MYRKSKSMFGKLLLLLLTLCCAIVLLFGLAACSETKGIASAVVNDNGELVITYTDGTSDNLGVVVGKDGEDGKDGQDGAPGKDGVDGEDGKDGADGRGISKVEFSADGAKLVITYTDNTTQEIAIPAYGTQCSHEKVECLVFKEHTKEVAGTYLLVCEDCGYSEVLHEFRHDYGDVEVVPPTCEEEGYTRAKPAPFAVTLPTRRTSKSLSDTIGAKNITLWKTDAPSARTAVCTSEYARAATW